MEYLPNFLSYASFIPLPKDLVRNFIQSKEKVVLVEQNYSGQLGKLIKQETGLEIKYKILKWNGRPISENEIYEGIHKILKENVKKVVLENGI